MSRGSARSKGQNAIASVAKASNDRSTSSSKQTRVAVGAGGRIGGMATSERLTGRGGRNWRFSSLASPNSGGGVIIGSVGPSVTGGGPDPGVLGRRRPKRFNAHLRKLFKSSGAPPRHSEKAVILGHRDVRHQALHRSSDEQEVSWNQATHVD